MSDFPDPTPLWGEGYNPVAGLYLIARQSKPTTSLCIMHVITIQKGAMGSTNGVIGAR